MHGHLAVLAVLALAAGGVGPAALRAQEPPSAYRLTQAGREASPLSVPQTLTAPASSSVALPLAVHSPRDLPPNSFLRVRGLPPAVSLTEGFAIAPGAWAVPLAALSGLRLVIPIGVSGSFQVTISLVSVDGAPLAEGRMQLAILDAAAPLPQTAPPPPQAPVAPAAPRATAPAQPPALTDEVRERAERLVQRGQAEVENGNIAQARAFFTRAADIGLALGAMMLAATYDPAELARLRVQGVQPNPSEARKWYERARELGAPEASERLTALDRR